MLASTGAGTSPATFFARLADHGRAQAFLWAETGLAVQERLSRPVLVGRGMVPSRAGGLPRGLLLGAVALDLWTGYATLRERARLTPDLIDAADWELQHRRGATRVRDGAATLGGVLIKAVQFASTRPDLLPAAYIPELAALQDRVPPRPWPEIEAAITRELGRPPGAVFARIEREAVAAASIAQVHRAWLPDGRAVAVKVQYPGLAALVEADLAALDGIVATIGRLEPAVRLGPIVDYLRETLPLELDFRREAAMSARLRAALAGRDDVLVPAPVDGLTTGRLLVSEWAEGIKITDTEALRAAGVDLAALARDLADLYTVQFLDLGLLHADPHPGNLLVAPATAGATGPRLVLLDHGLTVALPPTLVAALRSLVHALAVGDMMALTAALADAGLRLETEPDLTSLLGLVGIIFGEAGASAEDPLALGRRLGASVGAIPTDLLLVGRALGLLDGVARQLDPEFDALGLIARHG